MKTPTRKAERTLWKDGHVVVAGIDEVGRGAWAGPVTAAAVVLPNRCRLTGIRDSKLLTALQREQAAQLIKRKAISIGIGWASHGEVDGAGLTAAVRNSAERALIDVPAAKAIILDGNHNYLRDNYHSVAIIKADQSSLCVAAASVIAKVARDKFMSLLDKSFPQYGFVSNKGYGSRQHMGALSQHGISPYHRRRWRPIRGLGQLEIQFMEFLGSHVD